MIKITKRWQVTLGVLALMGASVMGAQWLLGARVAAQMEQVAEVLEARDDLRLTRFSYQRGFWGGWLDYELLYQPLPTTAAHAWLSVLDRRGELPLQGRLRVRYGPWLPDAGWVAGQLAGPLPMPDEWRPRLPALASGRQDGLGQVRLLAGWDGSNRLQWQLYDYQGELLPLDESSRLQVQWQGVQGAVEHGVADDSLGMMLQLDRLALASAEEAFDVTLDRLVLLAEHQRLLPAVWPGTFSVRAGSLALQGEAGQLALEGLSLGHDLGLNGSNLTHELFASFDTLQWLEREWGAGRLLASLDDLDAAAYSDLLFWRQQLNVPGATVIGSNTGTALEHIIERLLAASPAVSIEELSLSLAATHDTNASLRVQYTGPSRLVALDVFALPGYFEAEGQVLSTERALDALVQGMVADLPPAEQDAARAQISRELVSSLARWGFVGDGRGNIGAHARLTQGQLLVNDELMASSGDLFGWALDLMLSGM